MSSEPNSKPFLHEIVDRVCISQNVHAFESTKKFRCFRPHLLPIYHTMCDDYHGPMGMTSIVCFIHLLEKELCEHPSCKIVYCVENGKRPLTNAVFLFGSYMILKLRMTSTQVSESFSWLTSTEIEPFRDAAFAPSCFGLALHDCWEGLERGLQLGWVRYPPQSDLWSANDMPSCESLGEPDLLTAVPGKFLAFRGPAQGQDAADGCCTGAHNAEVFRALRVSDVVRHSTPGHDPPAELTSRSIATHDLPFPNGAAPPAAAVAAFLAAADAAPGIVAVHCRAGLGRACTLIALYMMRSCGFSARAAIGWLRIMWPGSVVGEQQRFLCAVEAGSAGPESAPSPPLSAPPCRRRGTLAAQVMTVRRCASVPAPACRAPPVLPPPAGPRRSPALCRMRLAAAAAPGCAALM
jgi:cell division cycle 14